MAPVASAAGRAMIARVCLHSGRHHTAVSPATSARHLLRVSTRPPPPHRPPSFSAACVVPHTIAWRRGWGALTSAVDAVGAHLIHPGPRHRRGSGSVLRAGHGVRRSSSEGSAPGGQPRRWGRGARRANEGGWASSERGGLESGGGGRARGGGTHGSGRAGTRREEPSSSSSSSSSSSGGGDAGDRESPQRVAKLMAWRGLCSRREAEALIAAGHVLVNGRVVRLGDKAAVDDAIEVVGEEGRRWLQVGSRRSNRFRDCVLVARQCLSAAGTCGSR